MIVPVNYVTLDRYEIVNVDNKKEINTVKVVQKVHPDLFDKAMVLKNLLEGTNLIEKSVVPLTLESQIESLNSDQAKDALVVIEKELERRETGNSDSWTWKWLNSSSSSESSWGLGGLWSWMSSFISNLGSYSTETLLATRDSLSRRLTSKNNTNG